MRVEGRSSKRRNSNGYRLWMIVIRRRPDSFSIAHLLMERGY
jgi:hypothetical protein